MSLYKYTIQDVVTEARRIIQDYDEVRYTDGDIVSALNTALSDMRRQRPDIRDLRALGTDTGFPYTSADLSVSIPVHYMFFPSMVAFVVGWLEMRDDEFVNDGRLQMLFATFRSAITEAST